MPPSRTKVDPGKGISPGHPDVADAIAAVRAEPRSTAAWTALEESATTHARAPDVARLYRELIAADATLAKDIGRRAVDFHDDWGEDPSDVTKLVETIFHGAPDAGWAIDRLKLTYSSEERWGDLLAVFEGALGSAESDDVRVALLEDAGKVARDFARDADLAISYFERLHAIRQDDRTRASLEKLYEKCGRRGALIGLYASQLGELSKEAGQPLRAKMASLYLASNDLENAFDVTEAMLSIEPESHAAFELLERIFATPTKSSTTFVAVTAPPDAAPPPSTPRGEPRPRSTRQRAALLLKPRYIASGRSRELVRVLQVELGIAASEADRAATYRELVVLQLETLRDDAGALDALAALVVLEPAEASHRASLDEVSARLGKRDRQANILTTAAERATDIGVRATLLMEAAGLSEGPLAAPARAIDLYQRVLALGDVGRPMLLRAARTLSLLLDDAGRLAERCAVLERVAELETDPAARRDALGEVARIASKDFGDAERAIRAWRARLDDDPSDAGAIAGLRETLGAQSRWRELTGVLERAAAVSGSTKRDLLEEAAAISERELCDFDAAIRLHEELLAAFPDDVAAMDRLAHLYRQTARSAEFLDVRRRQIEHTVTVAERVRLRLDVAAVLEATGAREERVTALQANLLDDPRDRATVDALGAAFAALGRFAELVLLSESQAEIATRAADVELANALWRKAGDVAEEKLGDLDRAILDHERARGDALSLDALARLYLKKGNALGAASALERLVAIVPTGETSSVLLRLSAAYVTGGRRDAARSRLEEAVKNAPDKNLRAALADIYRAEEAWTELADLRVVEARATESDVERAELLREAAELHIGKRRDVGAAIPLLEEAIGIARNPVTIALLLAPALTEVRRGGEAIAVLKGRVEAYGARRPKERALVHHALADALSADGQPAEAIAELELAVKIDPLNLPTRRALADAAVGAGDLETAQRMYRALLMGIPRRDAASPADIARSEVLLCLADVALRLKDANESKECMESALAAARESDAERAAAERELARRGMHEIHATLLEERLDKALDPEQLATTCDRLAALYEEHLGRAEDAFAMRLRALTTTPHSSSRHRAAFAMSRVTGRVATYLQLCADQCERATDPATSYELSLLYATALDEEGKLEDAAGALERAERAALTLEPAEAGGRRLDQVWKRLDRIYGRLGDDAARALVLERLAAASEARKEPPTDRAHVLYEIAALRLAHRDTQTVGLDVLARAFAAERNPDRAELALLTALEVDRTNERALRMYESLSRAPGRERALIDALQRLATLPKARSALREAAKIALDIGDGAASEALLRRFISEEAAENPSDPTAIDPDAADALLALSRLREAAGDIREALSFKEQAAARLDFAGARPILLDAAALSMGPLADLPHARELYARVHAEDPSDRDVWLPLAQIHKTLGDVDALSMLIDGLAAGTVETNDRAALQLDLAKLLLRSAVTIVTPAPTKPVKEEDEWGPVSPSMWPKPSMAPPSASGPRMPSLPPPARLPVQPGNDERAIRALWRVLEDDPSSTEAAQLLTNLLERGNRFEELATLLRLELERAKATNVGAAVATLSTRLASVLERCGKDDEAIAAYGVAVEWDPSGRAAHRAVLRLSEKREDPAQLAEVTETLLRLESGVEAERLALRLAELRDALGDVAGKRRALEAGIERCPESQSLRERLAEVYRETGEWKNLAELHLTAAETRSSTAERVRELQLAATVLRRELSDAAGAAAILERALAIAPDERNVLLSLVNAWSSSGEHNKAIAVVTTAITDGPPDQAALFHMRAVLHQAAGDVEQGIADLETAFSLTGGEYGEHLAAMLEEYVRAPEGSDRIDLRLRLAEVLQGIGRADDAARQLDAVLERDPHHRDARASLAALKAAAGAIDDAIANYLFLLDSDEGDSLVERTLAFADLCKTHDRLADLVPPLERASAERPDDARVRERLLATYEAVGENRKLADLLLADKERVPSAPAKFELLSRAARLLMDPDKGDPARARDLIAEARVLRPDDPETGLLMADSLIAAGKTGDALDLLEQLVSSQKRRSKARSHMHRRIAHIYSGMGARMNGLQSLLQAMDDDPQDAALAMEIGLAAVELNDLDATTRAFRAVTLMKTVPAGGGPGITSASKGLAYYHLARVAERQGDVRKARLLVEKSLGESATPEARALKELLKGG